MKKLCILLCSIFSLFILVACTSLKETGEEANKKMNQAVESTKEKAETLTDKAIQDAKDALNQKVGETIDKVHNKTEEKIDKKFENVKEDLTI